MVGHNKWNIQRWGVARAFCMVWFAHKKINKLITNEKVVCHQIPSILPGNTLFLIISKFCNVLLLLLMCDWWPLQIGPPTFFTWNERCIITKSVSVVRIHICWSNIKHWSLKANNMQAFRPGFLMRFKINLCPRSPQLLSKKSWILRLKSLLHGKWNNSIE